MAESSRDAETEQRTRMPTASGSPRSGSVQPVGGANGWPATRLAISELLEGQPSLTFSLGPNARRSCNLRFGRPWRDDLPSGSLPRLGLGGVSNHGMGRDHICESSLAECRFHRGLEPYGLDSHDCLVLCPPERCPIPKRT